LAWLLSYMLGGSRAASPPRPQRHACHGRGGWSCPFGVWIGEEPSEVNFCSSFLRTSPLELLLCALFYRASARAGAESVQGALPNVPLMLPQF